MQAVSSCRRAGVPVFVRGDSQLIGPRNILLRIAKAIAFSRLLRRFDGFLYVGQRSREYLLHYGAAADRLFFSPHCVDNASFRAASDAARQSMRGAPRESKRLLFVGKLLERKRPLDLLKAAAILQKKQPIEVAFAGSGELEGELREFARASGVPAIFHGFVNQSELPAVYAAADVIVLPSDGLETWGLAVNEAMACGLPAVVSDAVGCGPDLVEQGVTGAVFPVGRADLLASAMETAISLELTTMREHLAARMQVYSPLGAAKGIMAAAAVLPAAAPPKGKKPQPHA
jgi:glycosyltransferase involved in cell wall biosynthesis